jgi:polyribonucleotide nucleotidyltransferase
MEDSELDLVVAGTNDAVLMVESEAKELPEDVMLGAVMFGHRGFQPVIDAIIQLAEKCAKEPRDFQPEDLSELYDAVHGMVGDDLAEAYKITDQDGTPGRRGQSPRQGDGDLLPRRRGQPGLAETQVKTVFKKVEAAVVRGNILKTKSRIDGRDLVTVRQIESEVGVPAAYPWFGAVHPR